MRTQVLRQMHSQVVEGILMIYSETIKLPFLQTAIHNNKYQEKNLGSKTYPKCSGNGPKSKNQFEYKYKWKFFIRSSIGILLPNEPPKRPVLGAITIPTE